MNVNEVQPLDTVGNYDLLVKIAEGGAGTVYKGRNRFTGDLVAVKVILPSMATKKVLLQRFEQEFRTAHMLSHPNVVRALDFCGTGPSPFLVMEFIEGESLGEKIEREGRMGEDEAVRLIVQVCRGLHAAHQNGVIHRDVKPDNVMVTPDGQAKLTDLGLVKEMLTDLNLTRTGGGLGTPHFMAPEQFRNAKHVDVRSDVYSVGATLYQLVTGELPFGVCSPLEAWMKKTKNDLTPPRQLVPGLSEALERLILRVMSPEPAQRPASCRELEEELLALTGQAKSEANGQAAGAELWQVRYADAEGQPHSVSGSALNVLEWIKQGLFQGAADVCACKGPGGSYQPLGSYWQFRHFGVQAPAPAEAAAREEVAPAPPAAPEPAAEPEPAAPRARDLLGWLVPLAIALALALVAGRFLFPGK